MKRVKQQDQYDKKDDEKGGDGLLCFSVPLLTGGGIVSEWKLFDPTISSSPWAGTILLCLAGFIGLICLMFIIRSKRSWGIITLVYLIDLILTFILLWPIMDLAIAGPLTLWPYLLGTVATLIAGVVIGLMKPEEPFRHAVGIISLDLAVSGIISVFVPNPLTWALISRVVAAYGAVCMGAIIGKQIRYALRKDPNAMGKLVQTITVQSTAAIIAGFIVAIVLS